MESLNLPTARPCIIVTNYDLMSKPIEFWVNMKSGITHEGLLYKCSKELKRIVGYGYANSIIRMEMYGVIFSIGIYLVGKDVEVTVFCCVDQSVVFRMKCEFKRGRKFNWKDIGEMDRKVTEKAYEIYKKVSKP